MSRIKKVTLLVDGPNIYRYAKFVANEAFGCMLRDIKEIAEQFGFVDTGKAVVYFDPNVNKHPKILDFARRSRYAAVVGSNSSNDFRIHELLIKDGEKYLAGDDTDLLALSAGSLIYCPLAGSAEKYGKKLLLIYPSGETSKELRDACHITAKIRSMR